MLSRFTSLKSADPGQSESGHVSSQQQQDGTGKTHNRRPSLDRAITAALSTPHDAVLAELHGLRPEVNTTARVDAAPELPPITTASNMSVIERETGAPNAAVSVARSTTSTPVTVPELLHDPFTGGGAILIPPHTKKNTFSSQVYPPSSPFAPFEEAKDELWSQLARIRDLQKDIATMHVQMEGIGVVGETGRAGPKKAAQRTHTDTIVVNEEEWPSAGQEEHERQKEAQDREFVRLTAAFEKRHTDIDQIMNKLGDLSKALTGFHALPTPLMDFQARNNTKDSVFSSPSPTFNSPFSPPVSPAPAPAQNQQKHSPEPFGGAFELTTLREEIDDFEIPRAESPVSVDVEDAQI